MSRLTDEALLAETLRREGWPKFTNHPADRGGPTKGGITLPTLSKYRGVACTPADLKLMTREECCAIYLQVYFKPYAWIPSALDRLRILLIDYAITSWHDDAVGDLQLALGVNVDGVMGPQTKAALGNVKDHDDLYRRVYRYRQQKFFYVAFDAEVRDFLRVHPRSQLQNLAGWLNRLSEFV